MSLSSSLLSPESALRFPSSPGKGQSKCRGRAAAFMGAELSSARCLPVCNGHGGITQSPPQLPAWPQHWQVANLGFFSAECVWGHNKHHSYLAFNHGIQAVSAGQEEMGLNFVPSASLSYFPEDKHTMKRFLFAFFFDVKCHINLR